MVKFRGRLNTKGRATHERHRADSRLRINLHTDGAQTQMTDLHPRWMSLGSLESYVDACETTIESWMRLYGFPGPARLGTGKTRRWDRIKVDAWMNREGQQDPTADLLGRIRDGARQAAQDSDRKRGIRKRDQQVPGLGKVQEPGAVNSDKLSAQAPAGRTAGMPWLSSN